MNILLVDDDYPLAYSTAKIIQRLGKHNVYITDIPAEIFQRCQAKEIDLVLMDVNLPGAQWQDQKVSGIELAQLLKNNLLTANIPIILVSAYAMVNEREFFQRISQADDFIAKPITDYASLLKLIERLGQT